MKKINATVEIGAVDNLKDVIHELNEIVLTLELLQEEELREILQRENYEDERIDSLIIISEAEEDL